MFHTSNIAAATIRLRMAIHSLYYYYSEYRPSKKIELNKTHKDLLNPYIELVNEAIKDF
ncbi:MAG: hypothetical protein RLZZ546_1243, partial [Bacteroidota bacterium]